MVTKRDRIGIVGATSLLGKELSEALAESPLAAAEIVLLDEDVTEGQLSAAGDEASFVQTLEDASFRGLDLVFFAGSAELTQQFSESARRGGALVVDLTHALLGEPGFSLRAPAIAEVLGEGNAIPSLETAGVVLANPIATLLALLALGLREDLEQIAATVLLPASEHGRKALDELHQQTVNLLSFHPLPREQFDAQTAFNLLSTLGEEARINLAAMEGEVVADLDALVGSRAPVPLVQLLQAPVFHGYGASVLITLSRAVDVDFFKQRLRGRYVELAADEEPSNLAIAGRRELLVQIRGASADRKPQRQFWLWAAADNLKFRADSAIDCAMELRRLRPSGKVQ